MDDKKRKITITDEDREIIRNFRLMDDSFMEACFTKNKEAVELVLKIILQKDLRVIEVHTQENLRKLFSRAVRLDIVAVDSDGTVYNIEIQRSDKGGSAKRARYNSSMLDVAVSEPGDDFDELPESYVIFITENDVRGEGRAVYEFTYEDTKTHKPLGDGSHIIYVNNEYRDDSDIGRLMSDFAQTDPDKMNYDVLAETTRYFKENEEGVSDMCRVMEEKFQKGRQEGKLESVLSVMKKFKLNFEQALDAVGIPESEYGKYEKLMETAKA